MSTLITPATISLVHALLAACVTGHVLLHRRDAGSSVAWIGLAWLTPILGSVLYLLLGINRVRRRAMSLRPRPPSGGEADLPPGTDRDDHLAPLELASRRITHRPTESGNAITVLHAGDEAYPQMIAAINAAEWSIALSSYLFRADIAGNEFIDALARAAARGVEVRVLIDGIGGGYFTSAAYRRLRRAGVPAARFLHSLLPWRMPFLNLRNHKKLLGIDGKVAFAGGLNVGAENLTRLKPKHPVFDTHFKIEGPVVAQLLESFVEDWRFTTGETLTGARWLTAPEAAGRSTARAVTSGPDQDLEKIELLILQAVGCARESIKIQTPYFLPDERLITALSLAALRGVQVDVILPAHSNHPTVDWASRTQIGPLISAGCRIWAHPAPFNHSKLMIVDALWCLIGSSNWDLRSLRLNFELDLEVYDRDLASQLDALMGTRQGTRISAETLRNRSLAARLRDGAARLLLPYL